MRVIPTNCLVSSCRVSKRVASRLKEEATANAATAAVRPNTNTTTRVDLFFEKWFRFFLPHNCHPPRPLRPDG